MNSTRAAELKRTLAISLLQGAALYFLALAGTREVWPSTEPLWSLPLWTAALIWPVLLLFSQGAGGFRRALTATGAVAGLFALIAMYLGWQLTPLRAADGGVYPFDLQRVYGFIGPALIVPMVLSLGIVAFKALLYLQPLVAREPLSYSSLFRQSWRNLLVAALASGLAIGVFALLQLWAELFAIIGIDAFRSLFREPWFLFPVFALSFGLGVHVFRGLARIIDTLTGIIEGLLRLLLPLLAALIAMFLAALLFTGLAPLWNTGSGTALLMALNVLALIFLNGVYQTGEARRYPVAMHRAVYAGTVLLPAVSGLALYGLALRIGQYGFTVERCWALAVAVLSALFSCGYAYCIIRRRDDWPLSLAVVNRIMGLVVLAVLLLANTPLMDFRRISLNSQIERIAGGEIALKQFDFHYAYRYLGRPAWQWLSEKALEVEASRPELADRIRNPQPRAAAVMLARADGADGAAARGGWRDALTLRPEPFEISDSLARRLDEQMRVWPVLRDGPFEWSPVLIEVDLNGDGENEYVLLGAFPGMGLAFQRLDDDWRALRLMIADGWPGALTGTAAGGDILVGLPGPGAPVQMPKLEEMSRELLTGPIETAESSYHELRVGGLRFVVVE